MRNIQVNMQFNADTTAAKSQIQQLQQSLQNVANTKITVQGGSIDQATQSARILQQHLTAATNVDTGRLNFSALQASLKSANMDLNTLTSSLVAAGPAGQKAFSQVANAVAHAELSVKKTNSALAAFGTTLMNTIKWQIASMMIHATMSAFSDAVGHIKNLDSALNSIQIVTGKTSEEMANFAKQAQNLSKELSSTTEEYAKASLIFFQQGLGEKEVLERTEATIKMAKVTGDTVETVSNQLTAIWNNFDDGTQHLEHYVDVITALGAATASSTSEISDGLQKFAAIAETVGLSYEYAATALATVTAETRQSADVVGTAFKTLFARMEGLKLGETLDDGTTFNQYSEAMLKAGINIKDSAGNLKDMNDILDEMGEKWKTLNKDQQIALAQQVGGIRQYNQLMALMSNWDTFKVNLEIAEDSKGTLDEQFEIYQGSVEASAASLKNATQTLYENLLDPSTISGFNEGLEDAINLVNTLVENAGGLGKVLQFGGLLLLQMVLPKLQMFLTNASARLMEFIGYTKALQLDTITQQSNTAHTIAGTTSQSAWQSGRSNTFLPNTAGITQISAEENLGGADLRTQMVKEEAGFTASILDTKRQILALENGMTAKQKEGYKLYQDQVAQEQESLRIAREKQATLKDTAGKSSKDAAMVIGVSKGGKQYKEALRKTEIEKIEAERAAEHSAREKLQGNAKEKKQISQEIDKKYNQQLQRVQTQRFDNKKIDLSGQETKGVVDGINSSGISESGQNLTNNITQNMLTQSAGGGGPAASIENLEKLGQIQAQYNADAAKANGIYAELSGNIGEAGKRTQEQQKILQATQKTMNTLGADAKKGLVENLKKSASEAAKSGQNVSGLQKTLAKCGDDVSKIDLSKLNADELRVAQTATKNLGTGLKEASTSASALADAMSADMSKATGKDAKVFQGVAEDARVAKTGAIEADDAAKRLYGTLNNKPPIMPDPFGAVVQGAQQATRAFTSFAMGAQMLSTGITTFFNEDATAVEKLMGAMMMLQGVMSTLNAVKTAANLIDTIAIGLKAGKTVATGAETVAEEGNTQKTNKNTIATSSNAVAKLFAAMASKGLAGIIAGALGAALIVSTILTVKNTIATKADAEAKAAEAKAAEEAATSNRENADALAEETKELNKNADAYRELHKVYKETNELKTDYIEATYDLATALGVEGASLAVLRGEYDDLNAAIERKLQLKNRESKVAAQEATSSAAIEFQTKIGGNKNYWADDPDGDGKYTTGLYAGDSSEGIMWISNFLNSPWGKKYKDAGLKIKHGKLYTSYDGENPEELAEVWKLIDELLADDIFRNYATNAGYDVTSGTLFKNYRAMKETTGDSFDQLTEAISKEEEAVRVAGVTETSLYNATTPEEFNESYDKYIDYILAQAGETDRDSEKAQQLIENANEYLRSHSSYKDLFQVNEAFAQLPENVQKYAKTQGILKDDQKTEVFLQAYFDEHFIDDEMDQMLEHVQTRLDTEKLSQTVTFIPEMSGQLTDEMTFTDWNEWFANWEKEMGDEYFGHDGILGITKEQFMGMGAKRAQELLNNITPTIEQQMTNLDTKINGLKNERNLVQSKYDEVNANPLYPNMTAQEFGLLEVYADTWEAYNAGEIELGSQYFDGNDQIYSEMIRYAIDNGLGDFQEGDQIVPTREEYKVEKGEKWADNVSKVLQLANTIYGSSIENLGDLQSFVEVVDTEVGAQAERKGQLESYDTQIEQAEKEQQYLKAIALKQEVLDQDLELSEVEDLTESLRIAAKDSEIFSEDLANNENAAKEAAKQLTRYDRAVETAADNMEDWEKTLKGTDIVKQSKAVEELGKTYADMFDLDATDFSEEFLKSTDNLELMKQALNGSEEAYNSLQSKIAMNIIKEHFQELPGITQEVIDAITSQRIRAGDLIEFDSAADGIGAQLFNMYNQAVEAAQLGGASVADAMAQANALMQAVGFEPPEVEMVEKEVILTGDIPDGWTPQEDGSVTTTDASGNTVTVEGVRAIKTDGGTYQYKQTILVPKGSGKITKSTENLGGSKISDKGNKSGGSKPKKTSEAKKKKSEIVDRYKEIEDKLDDTQNAMDKASKAADRLYGPKRLKEMEKVNKALQTEIKQLKEKRKEAEQYLKIDQQDLNKAASALNISFTFDNENISNYEEAMTSVYNKREALLKSFGSTMNEKEQEQLDALDKKIEELKAAIEQYDETRELTEDLDNEIKDAMNEWQDNNYEQLTYKLELQVEINDRDLEVLEYYLSKTEDDFYKQAEGIGYLTQQVGIYNDKLEDNQKHLADLQQEYKDENISQANYIEGLKEIFSATVDDAQALADLDKQMLEYYGNTLSMAGEEISKYTDRMEHQTSVLEHFKNIMDIIGESTNYEALGVILEGQAQTIENELKVAQETYDFYSNEAAKKKELMNRAIVSGDMEAAELYRKEWEAAEAAAREAQDNMLSKTEEWAEAMKAVLENKLAGLAQTLENALTGGTSFDAITTQMERAASLQEEYLTSTNKIYETNKLINTAQKEIDKTTNTVAKKRLKSFQEETAQLQNKSKLSQYELDIQQAKYELLLAEIALEEAQQAKSTVRLQRDSEGNFGYVYTADANAVADAEQKLADAQNNLYNIGLDGANDYAQKYQQMMQEMTDTLKDITEKYRNGEYESEEEYHRAMEDAKAYYFQKLQDYSNLYQVALTTDSQVIADAWSTDFGIMTTKTEDWKKAVNGYLDEVNKAFEGWEEVVERVKTETVGQDLDALEDKTQAIVDASADLSEQITKKDGVIDSIEAEMTAVSAITSTYTQWRKEIAATIAENEKLMHQTNAIIAEEAGGKSSVSSKDGNLKTDNKDKSNATTSSTGASGNNSAGSKQPSLVDGSKVTVKKTARHFSRDGGNGTKMQDWVPGYTFTVIDIDGNEVLIGKGNSYSQATGWVRKTDLEGFKTGGYTGSWGSEGKLAMLHQKELILNADDTANFLASLEILREIINVIDLHSAHAQLSGLLSSPAYRDYNEPQTLEQQVHIEASFPNVQDRHEIEEAFTNLVNRASQFVNRK